MESLNLLESKTRGVQKIVKLQYNTTFNDAIFSGNYNFKLNHNYGVLKQLFIKATLSTSNNATTLKTPFAALLFSNVSLKTETSTLQKITPVYSTARLDNLYTTGLYQKIIAGVQPSAAGFTSGTNIVTAYLPLFFWFSDLEDSALDMHGRKQLYVEITTNSTTTAMGMSQPLTSSYYELICVYEQRETYTIPKQIKGSYDFFLEDTQSLANGATTCKFRLRCPDRVFSLSMLLVNPATGSYQQINSVQIDTPNSTLFYKDYQINYLLSDDPNMSYNQNSSLTVPFGSRNKVDNFIKFSQNMAPTYITVTFTALGAAFNLYTISEFHTDLITGQDGQIVVSVPGVF